MNSLLIFKRKLRKVHHHQKNRNDYLKVMFFLIIVYNVLIDDVIESHVVVWIEILLHFHIEQIHQRFSLLFLDSMRKE